MKCDELAFILLYLNKLLPKQTLYLHGISKEIYWEWGNMFNSSNMLHEDFYKHNIYTRGFLSRLKCWLLYVIFLLLRFFCKYSQQGLFYGHAMSYTKCQSNDKENNNYFLFVGSISSFHHHLFSNREFSLFFSANKYKYFIRIHIRK